MKINRNMSAVIANNQLLRTENKLKSTMLRLSSGYKINSAEDNPAGMAISNKMKAQIDALDKAQSNAADAKNTIEIADGALNEVSSILQRIRELSVQAANGTNADSDKQAAQDEIEKLTEEVDRISGATEYNTKVLLDGSSDSRVYTREVDAAGNAKLSNDSITRINLSDHVDAKKYDITVESTAQKAAASINSNVKPLTEGSISINGVSVKVTPEMSQDEYLQALQNAANLAGTQMQEDAVTGEITFVSESYGSSYGVNIELTGSMSALAGNSYTVDADGNKTPQAGYKVDAKGNAVADVAGKDAVVKAGNNLDDTRIRTDGNRVYVVGNGGFSMDFLLSDQIDTTAGSKDLQMDVTEIGSMTIQIGSNQYQEMAVRIPEVSSETLYLDTVDVTVAGGADRAISTLDDAIAYVSSVRSRMGSFENRLEYATNSLGETEENMTSAYSNLVDADMATEMTEYASQNILDQAGISVLSQANDLPQQVLSLLSK